MTTREEEGTQKASRQGNEAVTFSPLVIDANNSAELATFQDWLTPLAHSPISPTSPYTHEKRGESETTLATARLEETTTFQDKQNPGFVKEDSASQRAACGSILQRQSGGPNKPLLVRSQAPSPVPAPAPSPRIIDPQDQIEHSSGCNTVNICPLVQTAAAAMATADGTSNVAAAVLAPASAVVPSAGSKAARWAARTTGTPEKSPCQQSPHTSLLDPSLHSYTNGKWKMQPVAASAMEAWLTRAAAKQLHERWAGKCYDYCDEISLLKEGLSVHQIHARRFHLNPPDLQRRFSSIFKEPSPQLNLPQSSKCIPGLEWACSRLDSYACWKPSVNDEQQWMEMDVGRDIDIAGVVTQGHNRTPTEDGYAEEDNYVQDFMVFCRPNTGVGTLGEAVIWEKFNCKVFSAKGGGDARQEIRFPTPVRARYVRILVVKWKNVIALRAGVLLVDPIDDHASRSPFAVGGRNSKYIAPSVTLPQGASSSPAAGMTKAQKWIARAAVGSEAQTPAAASTSTVPSGEAGLTKSQKWAARAAAAAEVATTKAAPTAPVTEGGSFYTDEVPNAHEHYGRVRNAQMQYSGFLKDGLPHGKGDVRWPDGHGYSGHFSAGTPHGKGTHFYPDGRKVSINFVNGCPDGAGVERKYRTIEPVDKAQIFDVTYSGGTSIRDGANPISREETYARPHEVIRMPFVAFSIGDGIPFPGATDATVGNYPNIPLEDPKDFMCRKVVRKFIWARPKYGDQPLWNANEVRGNIVGIMRGPVPPAANASYALKVHYAQEAGAAAVFIVDWDPQAKLLSTLRVIDEGPIDSLVRPIPDKVDLKIKIPTVYTVFQMWKGFCEDEDAWLVFNVAKVQPVPGEIGFGFQSGFVVFPPIENPGLRKCDANTLMAQFLEDRKKEREEEATLLVKKKALGVDQAEENLKSREFYGGNFLESMNPFKQVKETKNLDTKMQISVVNTLAEKTGLKILQQHIQGLQRDLDKAIPVQLKWEEVAVGGLKVPVIKSKDVGADQDISVWSFKGKPQCLIYVKLPNGDFSFVLWFTKNTCGNVADVNLFHRPKGQGDSSVESFGYPSEWLHKGKEITWLVSIDSKGFHIGWDGVHRYTFEHRLKWNAEVAENLSVLHDTTKNCVEITKMSACAAILPKQKAPDIIKESEVDINMDEWTLVFRQTAPFEYSNARDFEQVKKLNAHDDLADNYSIIGELDNYRCDDGKFTFMLRYPEDNPQTANIWRQSSNPVTMQEEGVDDFEPIQSQWNRGGWGGLQRSDRRKKECFSFLDGSVEHGTLWAYPIGICKLSFDGLPGPAGELTKKKVELYVSTCYEHRRKATTSVDPRLSFWDPGFQGTPKDQPLCEHGAKKQDCPMCKDEFAGRFIIDHAPYFPCTPGHGTTWMFDCWQRGPGRLTFNSEKFFADISKSKARSCARAHWPVPYVPTLKQDNCTGYYTFQYKQEVLFTGFIDQGLPNGFCGLKWSDGTEFHGEFEEGEMTGYGRYLFSDGAEFRGAFLHGLPQRGFYHPPNNDARRIADYARRLPQIPIWHMSSEDLLHPNMPTQPLPQFLWVKADCLAVARGAVVPGTGEVVNRYEHCEKSVTARLVWARPIFADQPLWNADDVRGKIVVAMRGPRPPARACGYSTKLYHCQNAGAVGAVFVDWDPDALFDVIPRCEAGPLWPNGPAVKLEIPAFFTMNRMTGVLQEGAIHTIKMMGPTQYGLKQGWRVGFIWCHKQECISGMSKTEAKDLMQEFFAQRRQERVQENELLQDRLEDPRLFVEKSLENKEWMGGSFLDSVNFLKQDKNAPPPKTASGTVTQAMLSKLTSTENARNLAEKLESAGDLIGSIAHGAIATMTAEAASSEIVGSLQSARGRRSDLEITNLQSRSKSVSVRDRGRETMKEESKKMRSTSQTPVKEARRVHFLHLKDESATTGDRKTGQAPAASALIRADEGAKTPTRGAGAAAAEADAGTKSKAKENARLKEMIERLEHENSRLENENSERNSGRAQGRNASEQARRRQAVTKEASPLQDFLQQSSSAVKTSVASLFTPPQASKGSARPSWMNE